MFINPRVKYGVFGKESHCLGVDDQVIGFQLQRMAGRDRGGAFAHLVLNNSDSCFCMKELERSMM